MEFNLEGAVNADRVSGLFRASGTRAKNTRVVMDKIVVDMLRIEREVFASGGRRGGGSWAQLKPDTIKRKGSAKILRDTDALYDSVTEIEAPYQILTITNSTIRFGTKRPYAGVQQRGGGTGVPARPFLRFLPNDQFKWTRYITEHLMAPFIAGEK